MLFVYLLLFDIRLFNLDGRYWLGWCLRVVDGWFSTILFCVGRKLGWFVILVAWLGVFLLTFGCELWFCLVIVGGSGVGLIW